MKWKDKPADPSPAFGTARKRTFFALLPINIGGSNRWLEMVTVLEVWMQGEYVIPDHWVVQKFIDPS